MNMEDLYNEMKDFLKYVGLTFGQMELVEVTFHNEMVTFKYDKTSITRKI